MNTFGDVREIWMVAKRGVNVATSTSASFYTSERSAMAHAKDMATREMSFAIYRCELVADVIVDEARVIDYRPQAVKP